MRERLGSNVTYEPVAPGGARRAAELIASVIDKR
jgi:hypothetical protein